MRTDPHTLPLTTTCEPRHVCVLLTQINAFPIFIILFICIFIIIFHYIFFQVEITQTHRVSLTVDLMIKTTADYQVSSTHSRDNAGQRGACRTTPNYSEHCPIFNLCLVLGFSVEYFQTQLNLRN